MSRPSHQITYLEPEPQPQSSMRDRAPPIPTRGASGGEVPENIKKAREQIARERNLQRLEKIKASIPAGFGRSAGLSREQLKSVEKTFKAGSIREAVRANQERDAERARIEAFQNRSGRLTSSAIARENQRLEDARNHGQQLAQELLITALAKRRFGSGLPEFTGDGGEKDVKEFLRNKYGSDANAQAQAELFGRLLGNLPKPKKAPRSAVVGTRTQPPPIPQPEPEPEIIGA